MAYYKNYLEDAISGWFSEHSEEPEAGLKSIIELVRNGYLQKIVQINPPNSTDEPIIVDIKLPTKKYVNKNKDIFPLASLSTSETVLQGAQNKNNKFTRDTIDTPRKRLIENLESVRKAVCAYVGNVCDCKYIKPGKPARLGSEQGNGCCELRGAIMILSKMTDEEYKELLERE